MRRHRSVVPRPSNLTIGRDALPRPEGSARLAPEVAMAPVQIRRLEPADGPLAARALTALKPSSERSDDSVRAEDVGSFLSDRRNALFLANDGDAPVGYLVGYVLSRVDRAAPMVLLYEIEVAEASRRQGVGTALIDALKRHAAEVGACKIWVLTDMDNAPARALYRKAGGVEVGENLLIAWTGASSGS